MPYEIESTVEKEEKDISHMETTIEGQVVATFEKPFEEETVEEDLVLGSDIEDAGQDVVTLARQLELCTGTVEPEGVHIHMEKG